jgi:4-aminobutyrate aminotransferase
LARKIVFKSAEYGLLLGVVGIYGNVIRIAPPLVINQEECEKAIKILDKVFNELK